MMNIWHTKRDVIYTQSGNCFGVVHVGTIAVFLFPGARKQGWRLELFTPRHKFRFSRVRQRRIIVTDRIQPDAPDRITVAYGLVETAWGIMASAGRGDWTTQSDDWQDAAKRWRDQYHEWLKDF